LRLHWLSAESFEKFTTEAQRTQRSTEPTTEAAQAFAHPPRRVNLKGRSSLRTQGVPMDKRPLRKRTSSAWANQQGKLLFFDRANLGSAKPGVTRSVCGLGGTVDESVLSENVSQTAGRTGSAFRASSNGNPLCDLLCVLCASVVDCFLGFCMRLS